MNAGKFPAKTYSEIMEQETENKKGNRLYIGHNGDIASAITGLYLETLKEAATSEFVSLSDTAAIKLRTLAYVQACETAGTFPSVQGLAGSLGYSRQQLYECMNSGTPKETSKWLQMCRDAFSEILTQCSLKGACHPIVGIFIQKSQYQWREQAEIVITQSPGGPLGEGVEAAELQKKILGSIPEDDF